MEDDDTTQNKDFQILRLLERANQIANTTQLDGMLSQMLSLSMEISHATTGILYLLGEESLLVPRAVQGLHSAKPISETMLNGENYLACQCLQTGRPIGKELRGPDVAGLVDLNMLRGIKLRNTLVLPIPQQIYPTGVLQLFNLDLDTKEWVQFLCNRMATEIQKLVLLQVNEERSRRLQSMVGFLGRIDPTLEPQKNLETIIEDASKLLNAEVSSLFLTDEATNDLVLRISSRENGDRSELRVPRGQGIIGHVVQSGQTVLVKDASRDQRHYKDLDKATDFNTHSLIAVPVYSRPIHVNYGRSTTRERIIGGIEAINKINGEFDAVDLSLLQILANEASTVLQISNLFDEANELFLDSIRTLTAAIDAKDPYTKGHSQRVSDISVMIAKELDMNENTIRNIRIGSQLHDVGKLGIPDSILLKRGSLTPDEYEMMKTHPQRGEILLRNLRTLNSELEAVSQHHERLDGSGYPRGLKDEQISMIGRIVAVADAFDAMTSNRPYRQALSFDEAFRRLMSKAGSKFDLGVIEALLHVYQNTNLQDLFQRSQAESVNQDVTWMTGD